jgi:4-hydroxy-3-polyprenylbenzoate decarboxylase
VSDRALPLVMAITGASGAPYAVRTLEALIAARRDVWLIVSGHGWRLLQAECALNGERLRERVGLEGWDAHVTLFADDDRGASPASGSARTSGMLICPCSMGTLSAVSLGTSRSLIERAADVTLKERRPLVVVPRETPLSTIHLENMLRLARAGAVVMPAAPGFYHRPAEVADLVDFMAARVLDHLGVAHTLSSRWASGGPTGGSGISAQGPGGDA